MKSKVIAWLLAMMDGLVTREGITVVLEAFKEVALAGGQT
jgi:hypothetical protein